MSRYDGLIIPRSYSEYINKTDAATLQQALQLSGVLSGAVAAGDNKAVKSSAVNNALANLSKVKIIQISDCNNAYPDENGKKETFFADGTAINTPSNSFIWFIESERFFYSNNWRITQVATSQSANTTIKPQQYIRHGTYVPDYSTWTWGNWEKVTTETNIDGIIYNEFIDDLDLEYLSGSIFLEKHLPNLLTSGVFYSLEMTAIEKNTGKYVRVLYNCKQNTNASYKIKEDNGLGVSIFNEFGSVIINGNTNKLIQKTKILTIVQNGTYIPL